MSLELLLRSGAVAVEIDRDTSVIVFECVEHRIQQAIPLRRDNLPDLIQDFLTRHGSCDGVASTPGVVPPQRAPLQGAKFSTRHD